MDADQQPGAPPPIPSARDALIATVVVVLAIVAFVAIGTAMGITYLHGAFLFAWWWTGPQASQPAAFWPSVAGALAGTGTAACFALLTGLGISGIAGVLLLLALLLFVFIRALVPAMVNLAFMLYLTVASIPVLQGAEVVRDTIAGTLMMAALLYAAFILPTRFRRPAVAPSP